MSIKILKLRIKDKHAKELLKKARAVNFVWNYLNDLSSQAIKRDGKFLSGYDFQKYTSGSNKELGLHSQTVCMLGIEYATRRKQFKRTKLRWRKSNGTGRSLGWIPFSGQSIKYQNGQIIHNKVHYSLWDSYGLKDYKLKSGSFNEDSRGRWYINICVEFENKKTSGFKSVGIDLGCKDTATDSNGHKITGRHYRNLEESLGKAQRARKKVRVKAIHAKIKNRRKDEQHKYTTKLVKENAAIFVGDVSSKKLVKTKLAKSVMDAGWHQLKTMLEYKCAHAGVVFEVVDERYTSQTCSQCGSLPTERPKGIAGLVIREWTCSDCGVSHDRDINAAKNILALGHGRLAGGIPFF